MKVEIHEQLKDENFLAKSECFQKSEMDEILNLAFMTPK